jgi:hypothetical protein
MSALTLFSITPLQRQQHGRPSIPQSACNHQAGMHRCADADSGNAVIRKVNASSGNISTIAGPSTPQPYYHVLAAADGNVYYTDSYAHRLYQYTTTGSINNITLGDSSSQLVGMAFRASTQTLYVGDDNSGTGVIYSVNVAGPFSSNPPTVSTLLAVPVSYLRTLALDNAGTLYMGWSDNPSTYTRFSNGTIAVWNNGTNPAAPGATARDVVFNSTYGVAVDSAGNLLISDMTGCKVWLANATTGKLLLVAGVENGDASCGSSFWPNSPQSTQLSAPMAVAFGADESTALITDFFNHRLLQVRLNCATDASLPPPPI